MDLLCAADGRPSMAIDPLCCPGRDPRIRLAEESGPRTLLGLADGVREVLGVIGKMTAIRTPSKRNGGCGSDEVGAESNRLRPLLRLSGGRNASLPGGENCNDSSWSRARL